MALQSLLVERPQLGNFGIGSGYSNNAIDLSPSWECSSGVSIARLEDFEVETDGGIGWGILMCSITLILTVRRTE